MAIIYSYPIATPQDTDLLIISRTPTDPDEISNYSVSMSSVADYVIDEAFNGTDRYIPRFDGTSSLVNSVIYEDSNGTIGIGTANPSQKLHVVGNARVTGAYRDSLNSPGTSGQILSSTVTGTYWIDGTAIPGVPDGSGTTNYTARWIDTDTLGTGVLYDNGTNVGIGTTSPAAKLDVAGRAVIGTGNTLTNATNATVIGNSNNLTNDSIVDSNTNLVLGDYGAGRYANTVISDRTLRLGRADVISDTSSNTTGILNFNDSVEANSAFSNVGGLVGYFPPPTTTNDYYFISAFSENVNGSAFQTGASPTASRYNMSTSPSLSCIGQKFDANTTNGGAMYITASNNSPTPSSRGIFTFDARHQNQNYAAPDGHALFEVTSGYGQTKFIIKQVNGSSNVGIGTTSPRGKLDVNGGEVYVTTPNGMDALKISDADVKIGDYDDANGYAFLHLDTEFKFTTDSTEAMRIAQNGNVGIATTSPSAKLHIEGDGSIIRLQNNNSDANGTFIDFRDSTGTRTGYLGTTGASDDMFIFTQASKPIRFFTNATERARISANGNVGIGTTSPTHKLQVFGNGAFNSTLDVQDPDVSSNGLLRLSHDSTGSSLYSNPASSNVSDVVLRLGINNSEKMRIANNGNVGIGTTSPTSKLEVDGGDIEIDDSASGLILRSPNGTRYRVQVDNSGNLTTTAI